MIETRIINGSQTEIYVGGGKYLTQSYATNFHTFHTRVLLTDAEEAAQWKEVTAAEKSALEAADAKWIRPSDEFIRRWNKLWEMGSWRFGVYNESTGFFEGNGLTDITTPQAEIILDAGRPTNVADTQYCDNCRTLLPFVPQGGSVQDVCSSATSLETFRIVNYYVIRNYENPETRRTDLVNTRAMFTYCSNLKKVFGPIRCQSTANFQHYYDAFLRCSKLEEIKIDGLIANIYATANFPKLSMASVKYMVEHALNTNPISISLHADVYSQLTDELIAAAAERQITFTQNT